MTIERLARTVEQGWTIEVTPAHREACARHGFTAIRLLICFAAHGNPAHGNPAGLDPGMLRRLEAIIPWGIWSLAPTFAVYDLAARVFDPDLPAALMD